MELRNIKVPRTLVECSETNVLSIRNGGMVVLLKKLLWTFVNSLI